MFRVVNPYYSGPLSDHFDGLRFFNADHVETDRGLRDILRWKLQENSRALAAIGPGAVRLFRTPLLLECGRRLSAMRPCCFRPDGLNVLTDPIWSERASPLPFAGPSTRVGARDCI
jgi:hypothetical protein